QLPPALITPLEVRTCDVAPGNSEGDLDRFAREFNGLLTESAAPEHDAYALFPVLHSDEIDFDLAWVSHWPDGATMGESMAHWRENRTALRPALESFMTCRDSRN